MPSVFLDTNVLLYAVTTNPTEMAKRARAIEVMQEQPFGLSGQVLAEFYDRATQARRGYLTPDEARQWLMAMAEQPCVPVDFALVEAGVEMSQRYKVSYWDGAILAAAERLGASVLFTEDLSHGQSYGAVRVVNPFREAA